MASRGEVGAMGSDGVDVPIELCMAKPRASSTKGRGSMLARALRQRSRGEPCFAAHRSEEKSGFARELVRSGARVMRGSESSRHARARGAGHPGTLLLSFVTALFKNVHVPSLGSRPPTARERQPARGLRSPQVGIQ